MTEVLYAKLWDAAEVLVSDAEPWMHLFYLQIFEYS